MFYILSNPIALTKLLLFQVLCVYVISSLPNSDLQGLNYYHLSTCLETMV